MKASEILSAATERLSRRGGWTQNAMARLPDHRKTNPEDPEAVCYCARGAIMAVIPLTEYRRACEDRHLAENYVAKAAGLHGPSYIVPWNDGLRQTKRKVVAAFRRAREAAIKDGN